MFVESIRKNKPNNDVFYEIVVKNQKQIIKNTNMKLCSCAFFSIFNIYNYVPTLNACKFVRAARKPKPLLTFCYMFFISEFLSGGAQHSDPLWKFKVDLSIKF